ncbi:hypothetical protein KJ359_012093 [Pestalotiopsis sp. 9143b]|nr:hypothetical protein KJ359_012093 [Pestalotiopsis sp. 9143b]
MGKGADRITGGFRILATGKYPEQRVIIPHQFTKFVGDVLIHINGHYEHMKAMEHVIEHYVGKPEGPLRSFNTMLLDLAPEQETALRAEYLESDATSLGSLAVGDAYFDCKVFHSWDPEQTQVEGYRDDDSNVMVTFYDYGKNCIDKFLIARWSAGRFFTKLQTITREVKEQTDDKEENSEEARDNEDVIFAMLKPD